MSPAGTGSCSGSGARCQQDDLWLCVLGGGWTWSHCHSGPERSTAWPNQRLPRTLKDITMPVIKWLGGKGSSHKTARRKRTIGGETTDDTNSALRHPRLVRLGIPLLFLSSPLWVFTLMTKHNSSEKLIFFSPLRAEDANSLGLHRAWPGLETTISLLEMSEMATEFRREKSFVTDRC